MNISMNTSHEVMGCRPYRYRLLNGIDECKFYGYLSNKRQSLIYFIRSEMTQVDMHIVQPVWP